MLAALSITVCGQAIKIGENLAWDMTFCFAIREHETPDLLVTDAPPLSYEN